MAQQLCVVSKRSGRIEAALLFAHVGDLCTRAGAPEYTFRQIAGYRPITEAAATLQKVGLAQKRSQ